MKRPKGLNVVANAQQLIAQLYDTIILKVNRDTNILTLNSGGWYTNHTKKCMNLILNKYLLPFRVYQRNNIWYIQNKHTNEVIEFKDKIELKI